MIFYKCGFLFSIILLFNLSHCQILLGQNQKPENTFSVANLNCWGLHVWIPGIERKNRYPRIIKTLDSLDADVFTLQECFHNKLRKKIIDHFGDSYNFAVDLHCNSGTILKKDCFGGLVTISKHPILESNFYPFSKNQGMKMSERLGKKGFIVSKININGTIVYIINTHLYAGTKQKDEIQRLHQFNEIVKYIRDKNLLDEKIIFSGDLNIEHPKIESPYANTEIYNTLLSELKFSDAMNKKVMEYTYDSTKNKYVKDNRRAIAVQQIFDYILYKNLNCKSQELIAPKPEISDHFGLMSIFY